MMWAVPADVREHTEIGRYLSWLEAERAVSFEDYRALWRWSVEDLEGFWSSIWEFFDVVAHAPYERVLAAETMPGASWFQGARLNYAEHLLADADPLRSAVISYSQTRPSSQLTFAELRDQVARVRAGLRRLGVGRGDRVAAYLPNIPETLIAFAATASLGAAWASCAPELGARSVVDRLAQLEPTVLLAVSGYGFRDQQLDRRGELAAIRAALPSLRHLIEVPYGVHALPDAISWEELACEHEPLEFEPVAFAHPLYVLFTSGTTGPPKAIVHGHGGILLEHLKAHALSWDLKADSRLLWFTTTSWMMWNALVSALLLRCSIVMVDGDPGWPDLGWQWRLAAESQTSFMGASPGFLMACRKAGLEPGREHDLSSLRGLGTAGSPLPVEGYRYVHEQVGSHALLLNGSGGTDICSAIVTGCPLLAVWEGELSGPALGVAASAFNAAGEEVRDSLGELVITRPMPSMPVGFWGDDDGSRYRAAYFEDFPGVWRQGDWVLFTERGSCVITGRSDATLNRGGVRLGTAEFYAVVEEFDEVGDALVVHLEDESGGVGELLLFVALRDGAELDDALRARMAAVLRSQLSPRHVPDEVFAVPAIPRTLTGKKLEAPIKRVMQGEPPASVASPDALLDPSSLDAFVALAQRRARPTAASTRPPAARVP